MNTLQTALKVFRALLENGQLDRDVNEELFIEYMNPEVLEYLNNFEEEMDCRIVRYSNTIYLIPSCDNKLLGFRTKDLREWFGANARLSDVFLMDYIVMFVLYLFYAGKNKNPKQREFLRISTLLEELDRRFTNILSTDREEMAKMEDQYSINFIRIAEIWVSKKGFEEKKLNTKMGTVLRVCKLLEQEKLVRIVDDEKEIRTTRKLDDLMINYYLNDNRVLEVQAIFEERGEQVAANQQDEDNKLFI
jgi:hypothetical protein